MVALWGAVRGAVVALLIYLPWYPRLSLMWMYTSTPHVPELVTALAIACGIFCGVLRAAVARRSALFTLCVWLVGMVVFAMVPARWPQIVPFGEFLHCLAVRPDKVLVVWFQLGLCAAAMDMSLEASCSLALRGLSREQLARAAIIGVFVAGLYAGRAMIDLPLLNPYGLTHVAGESHDTDGTRFVRCLSMLCALGAAAGVLSVLGALTMRARKGSLLGSVIVFFAVWAGFIVSADTVVAMLWNYRRHMWISPPLEHPVSRALGLGLLFFVGSFLTRVFKQTDLTDDTTNPLSPRRNEAIALAIALIVAVKYVFYAAAAYHATYPTGIVYWG